MPACKTSLLFSLLFIFGLVTACAQTRPRAEKVEEKPPKFEVKVTEAVTGKRAKQLLREAARKTELSNKYHEEDRKCDQLINDRKLKEAETVCKAALRLAEQLEPEHKYERMGAYEAVGHTMLGQQRYEEALDYYTRAFDLGQPQYTEEDASLGRLYSNLAFAHYMLGDSDKARQHFRKAEQIYHYAYTTFVVTNTAEGLEEQKQIYLNSLKTMLKYHRLTAEETGATAEIEEIDKLMKSLP